MQTIRLFLKKILRTEKLRYITIILLQAMLYLLIFVILLSAFSTKKSAVKTYEMNLRDNNAEIVYNGGLNNISDTKYLKIKNDIKECNILKIYSKNKVFDLYDFDYFNLNLIEGSLDNTNKEGVYLSSDYKAQYNINDYYKASTYNFKILGFFEGEDSVIADLSYIINLGDFDIKTISIEFDCQNIKNRDINKILNVYNKLKNNISSDEYLFSSELDTIKEVNKVTNIYITIAFVLIIIFSVFSIFSIINIFNINEKMESMFYTTIRLSGLSKKNLYVNNILINILTNVISFLLSLILFYISYGFMKTFLKKFINTIFELFIDDFMFDIKIKYYDNVLIFIIPLLINIVFIILKMLITYRHQKNYINLVGLDEYAR